MVAATGFTTHVSYIAEYGSISGDRYELIYLNSPLTSLLTRTTASGAIAWSVVYVGKPSYYSLYVSQDESFLLYMPALSSLNIAKLNTVDGSILNYFTLSTPFKPFERSTAIIEYNNYLYFPVGKGNPEGAFCKWQLDSTSIKCVYWTGTYEGTPKGFISLNNGDFYMSSMISTSLSAIMRVNIDHPTNIFVWTK
jgi:hypothetical protein